MREQIARVQYSFKRREKKYIIDADIKNRIIAALEDKIEPDINFCYKVCNIYYDTQTFDLIRRSIEKPVYKEKLRLRSYGIPEVFSDVFIEIKKKYNGIVYKRRIKAPYSKAADYLNRGIPLEVDGQIYREIDYALKLYQPVPKVLLTYDRTAYFAAENSSMRLTFDENIRARDYDVNMLMGDYGERLIPKGLYVMEIKLNGGMPLWMARVLSELEVYPKSFSKYGQYYKMLINESAKDNHLLPLQV